MGVSQHTFPVRGKQQCMHACIWLVPVSDSIKAGGEKSRSPRAAGIDRYTARFELFCQHSAVSGLTELAHSVHSSRPALLLVAAPTNSVPLTFMDSDK